MYSQSIEVGTVQNHQSFQGVSFAWRELSKCFAGDEQRHGARSVARMPRGAIEWRNEGEVSSVDVRCGGLSGRTNRGSIATGPPMQMPVPSISKSHIQGLNLPDLTDSVEFLRGGFWRRAVALFIDLVAVVAVLQVTALALFPLSNGHVQFSAGLLYALNCEYLESVPEGLSISVEFDANSIADCQQSLLGLPTSRALSVSRITRDSAVTKVAQIRHMLDAEGKPASGLPLDILILPLLIALRFALDRIGGSIGRRICCIRLSNGLDGQYPPPAASMKRRYAALALPLAPVWIWSSCAALFPGSELVDPRLYWLCWVGTGIPLLIAALAATDSIIRRRDAFYDRIAGTSVLRLDEKKAVIAMAGVAPPPSLGQSDSSRPHIMPEPSYVPSPLSPQQASRSRNYIARHWRGELSLPVSYWLNGILGAVVVGATVGVLAAYATNQQSDAQPMLWLFSLIATWTSATLLTIWQAVGVWRSATRYRQRGKRFWGAAAKALVLLGVAQLTANFVMVGTAQMAGIYEIVSGDARVGPHQFHILANGETLEFSGGITFGVTQELEQFLNAMAGRPLRAAQFHRRPHPRSPEDVGYDQEPGSGDRRRGGLPVGLHHRVPRRQGTPDASERAAWFPSAGLSRHDSSRPSRRDRDRTAAAAGIRIEQRIRSAGYQRLAEWHVVSRQGRTRQGARGNARDFTRSGKPDRQVVCRYIIARCRHRHADRSCNRANRRAIGARGRSFRHRRFDGVHRRRGLRTRPEQGSSGFAEAAIQCPAQDGGDSAVGAAAEIAANGRWSFKTKQPGLSTRPAKTFQH